MCSTCLAAEKYLAVEGNISKFYDTPSTVLTGMGAGFGWQWRLDETYRLSSGIHLVERAGRVVDKKVSSEYYQLDIDADWRVVYLEIPFILKKRMQWNPLNLMMGISASLGIMDGSEIIPESDDSLDGYDEKSADYSGKYETGPFAFESSMIYAIAGASFRKRKFEISNMMRFTLLGSIDDLTGTTNINHKFVSVSIQIGYYF
jgi:hypothetical protein